MIKELSLKTNPSIFLGTALLLLSSLSSCMKKPDHTPDYGPEVPLSEIQKASNTGIPALPDVIQKNQKISIDWFRVIQTNSPITFYQRADTVTLSNAVTSSDGGPGFCWDFYVYQRQLDFNTNVWKEAKDTFSLAYPSPKLTNCTHAVPNASGSPEVNLAQALDFQLMNRPSLAPSGIRALTVQGLAFEAQAADPDIKYTYHKLIRETGEIPLLPALSQNPGWCGRYDGNGQPLCPQQLKYVRIGFDRVTHRSGDKDVKVTYRFTYSSDVPTYIYDWQPGEIFLTNQLESCVQMWVDVKEGDNSQNIPLRECMQVTDFQFGK